MSNNKALSNAGAGKNSIGFDSDYLNTALYVQFTAQFLADFGETAAEGFSYIDIILGDQLCLTSFITQGNVKLFHCTVSFYR